MHVKAQVLVQEPGPDRGPGLLFVTGLNEVPLRVLNFKVELQVSKWQVLGALFLQNEN